MDDLNFATVPDQSTDRDDGFSYDSNFSSPISLSPSADTGSTPSGIKVHHARYFIKDDMTVFLISGEILFRVHRHYLDRESEIFRSYLSGTEENPISLPGVLPEEFEALVEYFYDGVHGNISKTPNEWKLLLSISTRFKMDKLRLRAITELRDINLDPVDKIVVAVKHDVPAWLEPAYVELCQREEPIREEEAERLGLNIAMRLARAREYVRDPVWVHQNPVPTPPSPPRTVQSIEWAMPSTSACEAYSVDPDLAPTKKRLDTAHVKRVVRFVFRPCSSSITPDRKESPDFTESDDGAANVAVSKKHGVVPKKHGKKKWWEVTCMFYFPAGHADSRGL